MKNKKLSLKHTFELIGLCGAGKSTFILKLKKYLRKYDYKVDFVYPSNPSINSVLLQLFLILIKTLLKQPITTCNFLRHSSNWWLIKKLAFRQASYKRKKNNVKTQILIDSGILQPFISFEIEYRKSNIKIPIKALLSSISLPDYVLVFEVNESLAMKRYEDRGLRNEGYKIRKNSLNFFKEANIVKNIIVKYCKKNKKQVLKIDSTNKFTIRQIKKVVNLLFYK